MSKHASRRFWAGLRAGLVVLAGFLMMVPIIWIVLAAFKRQVDVFQLKLLFQPTLDNFSRVFGPPT